MEFKTGSVWFLKRSRKAFEGWSSNLTKHDGGTTNRLNSDADATRLFASFHLRRSKSTPVVTTTQIDTFSKIPSTKDRKTILCRSRSNFKNVQSWRFRQSRTDRRKTFNEAVSTFKKRFRILSITGVLSVSQFGSTQHGSNLLIAHRVKNCAAWVQDNESRDIFDRLGPNLERSLCRTEHSSR